MTLSCALAPLGLLDLHLLDGKYNTLIERASLRAQHLALLYERAHDLDVLEHLHAEQARGQAASLGSGSPVSQVKLQERI